MDVKKKIGWTEGKIAAFIILIPLEKNIYIRIGQVFKIAFWLTGRPNCAFCFARLVGRFEDWSGVEDTGGPSSIVRSLRFAFTAAGSSSYIRSFFLKFMSI